MNQYFTPVHPKNTEQKWDLKPPFAHLHAVNLDNDMWMALLNLPDLKWVSAL